ncbi:DUF3883 domain-containing protein, partial [Campylobacter helveticus]
LDLNHKQICVEVKGLSEDKGQFLLTQKEFEMAQNCERLKVMDLIKN